MSFSLNQRGYPHEEKVLMGERREVESPGRISQNDILLKFPLGFFLYQCGNPYIPSSFHKEILLVRISSLTKRKTHGCPRKLPRVLLFVKEEILTRRISLWGGGGGGRGKEYEDFLFDEENNLIETSIV